MAEADDRPERGPVLVLGGTSEANALASALNRAGRPVTLSLAGRTRTPGVPAGCALRTGGFGGSQGLAAYCNAQGFAHLVDATHPFASRMAANAAEAARILGHPAIKLLRPAWTPTPGEVWHRVEDEVEAAEALPSGARPFLALGRQHIAPFLHRADLAPVLRMIEAPESPLPASATLVRARPGRSAADEIPLFTAHAVTHLVSRNAGGTAAHAKIEAAREMALPVVMIERPAPPPIACVGTVAEALSWLGEAPSPDGLPE